MYGATVQETVKGRRSVIPLSQIPHVVNLSVTFVPGGQNVSYAREQVRSDADFIGQYIVARSDNQNWSFLLYNKTIAGQQLSAREIFGPLNTNGEQAYFHQVSVPFCRPWRFPAGSTIEARIVNDSGAPQTIRLYIVGYYEILRPPSGSPSVTTGPSESTVNVYSEESFIEIPYILDLTPSAFTGNSIGVDQEDIPGDGSFFACFLTGMGSVSNDWDIQLTHLQTGKTLANAPVFGPLVVRSPAAYINDGISLETEWLVPSLQSLMAEITNRGGPQIVRVFVHGYRRLKIITSR